MKRSHLLNLNIIKTKNDSIFMKIGLHCVATDHRKSTHAPLGVWLKGWSIDRVSKLLSQISLSVLMKPLFWAHVTDIEDYIVSQDSVQENTAKFLSLNNLKVILHAVTGMQSHQTVMQCGSRHAVPSVITVSCVDPIV